MFIFYKLIFIPSETIFVIFSINESISFGVTIKLKLFNFILSTISFSSIIISHAFNVSITIVAASSTVGIPTLITGIFKVLSESSACRFPTPPPGTIPVSEICIDLFILSIFFEHKLSIAITSLGFILSTITLNITTD